MLTILAPIEIKAKSTYLRDPESFYHRIIGNYSLMETRMDPEDLLHISATPPEIYVQEGEGMTSILSQNQRNETNLQKVEILNNVLNRIVVSADTNLTYQDRVFITDALYKLGVRDERRFMKAFYQMAEETKNTNTLINLYLERGGELRELVESIETRSEKEKETLEEITERQRENFLYSSVMRRLQTGAIYQIVSNFNRSTQENEIDAREYSLSDQTYTAQQILLSMLRERAGVTEENLFFLNANNIDETIEGDVTETEQIRNELTRAVFLDVLKNIYHTGYEKFYNNNETYYRFEDTFFRSSDQTFLRLINNVQDTFEDYQETQNFITENNRLTSSEIELLEKGEEEGISQDELVKITETVNAINVQNEKRRREYVKALEQIRTRQREASPEERMEKTRRDAALALSNPEALMEQLTERQEVRERMREQVIKEMQTLFPDSNAQIYQLINEYYQGNTDLVQNNIVRPAEVGELLYDIQAAEQGLEEEIKEKAPISPEAREFIEAVKRTRLEEQRLRTGGRKAPGAGGLGRPGAFRPAEVEGLIQEIAQERAAGRETKKRERKQQDEGREKFLQALREAHRQEQQSRVINESESGPVETIHRRSETLTAEELDEQISQLQNNISKQINKEVQTTVINEEHVTTNRQVQTTSTNRSQLSAYDIEKMIERGVQSQMNTISNQVIGKLERQMRNEKTRRGYT